MRKGIVARLLFLFRIYVKFCFSRYRKTSRYGGSNARAALSPPYPLAVPASATAPPPSAAAVPASATAPPLFGAAVPASADAQLLSHCSAGGLVSRQAPRRAAAAPAVQRRHRRRHCSLGRDARGAGSCCRRQPTCRCRCSGGSAAAAGGRCRRHSCVLGHGSMGCCASSASLRSWRSAGSGRGASAATAAAAAAAGPAGGAARLAPVGRQCPGRGLAGCRGAAGGSRRCQRRTFSRRCRGRRDFRPR